MLCYKHLWMVERAFRTSKSLFATRPIFHNPTSPSGRDFCDFRGV
jgi:hypothetical protein